jgi:hypothetical protein
MLAIVLLTFLADADPVPETKILARGPWSQARVNVGEARTPRAIVLRDGKDLVNLPPYNALDALPAAVARSATAALARDLKLRNIDWKTQMVVIVLGGMKPSGNYSVEVTGVRVVKGELKVSWKVIPPDDIAPAHITYPSEAVLLPRFAGKVVFDPPMGQ